MYAELKKCSSFLIQSTTFQEPSPDLTKEFNITWDSKAYGNGPIRNSFAPFQWPGISEHSILIDDCRLLCEIFRLISSSEPQWKVLTEVGCEPQIDGSNGNAYGVF